MVKVIVVKEVEPADGVGLETDEQIVRFLEVMGHWVRHDTDAFLNRAIFGLAPSAEEIEALIESTYGIEAECLDIGTGDLARNILALFGCGDLRIEQEVDGERSRAE